MHDHLAESTRTKARELARQITVAQDLDPEIQEELYGHIEDKLLAYKNGEEVLTDDDAFILVREHFGDPGQVRTLLRETHREAADVSLFRQLLALAIATLGMYTAGGLAAVAIRLGALWLHTPGDYLTDLGGQFAIYFAELPALYAGLFFLLFHWKRAFRAGRSPLFCRWSAGRLLGVFFALIALRLLLPSITFLGGLIVMNPMELTAIQFLRYTPLFVSCALWIWWTDAPALGLRRMAAVLGAWIACTVATQWSLINAIVELPSEGSVEFRISMLPIGEGSIGPIPMDWYLNPNVLKDFGFFAYPPTQLLIGSLFCGGLMWVIYRRLALKPTFGNG